MSKENRIGALWRPEKSGDNYPAAKGSIEVDGKKIKIVVWRNRWKKEGERSPDLYIELDNSPEHEPPRRVAPRDDGKQAAYGKPAPVVNNFSDDIPF